MLVWELQALEMAGNELGWNSDELFSGQADQPRRWRSANTFNLAR